MPKINKAEANERNEGRGATMAAALLEIATPRAISSADLFCSLAAMVMRQNPNLGAKLLDALELSVRQHPAADVYGGPLGNVTETAEPAVTGTVMSTVLAGLPQYCPSPAGDGVCSNPMACKAGCEREFGGLHAEVGKPAVVERPADVAFEAPADATTAAA